MSWLQNRLKAAEELLNQVDRQAKTAAVPRWDSPTDGRDASSVPIAHNKPQVIHDGTTQLRSLLMSKLYVRQLPLYR